jgi:hypothetical protein
MRTATKASRCATNPASFFDIDTAMAWLSQASTGQSYEIELFEPPIPVPQLDAIDTRRQRLHQSFTDGLSGAVAPSKGAHYGVLVLRAF